MYVGKKIKQLRLSHDLNQTEMANKLNVSQPYYSSVESGKKPITQKMLHKLKFHFLVDISYFLDETINEDGYNKGGKLKNIPETNSREYYKRVYEGFEIDKNAAWQKLNSEATERLQKIDYFRHRIIDAKEIIENKLKIKIGNDEKTSVDSLTAFERSLINKFGGELINGCVRADNSTFDELKKFNADLIDLANLLELRFFELFKIIYLGLSKDYPNKSKLPEFID